MEKCSFKKVPSLYKDMYIPTSNHKITHHDNCSIDLKTTFLLEEYKKRKISIFSLVNASQNSTYFVQNAKSLNKLFYQNLFK